MWKMTLDLSLTSTDHLQECMKQANETWFFWALIPFLQWERFNDTLWSLCYSQCIASLRSTIENHTFHQKKWLRSTLPQWILRTTVEGVRCMANSRIGRVRSRFEWSPEWPFANWINCAQEKFELFRFVLLRAESQNGKVRFCFQKVPWSRDRSMKVWLGQIFHSKLSLSQFGWSWIIHYLEPCDVEIRI